MITEELLEKCKNRDIVAWDRLARMWSPVLAKVVRYKVNKLGLKLPHAEIEDIVQDIFLMIWEKDRLSGVKSCTTLKAWMIITSLNYTSAYCRKFLDPSKVMDSLERPVNGALPELTLKDIIPDSGTPPFISIEAGELKSILEKEISSLPHKQRLAVILNVFENKKQKEIAGIMRMPEATVATLLGRAKKVLRSKIDLYKKNEII